MISRGLDVDQYNLMFVYGCNFAQPFWNVADPGIAAAIIADETTNSVLRISSTLRNDIGTLKFVVMQKDDLRKVKYLTNTTIMSDEAIKIARILKKMKMGGVTERDGRNSMKVIERGIDFAVGKAKFQEMRLSIDEIVDDEMTKTVMEKILIFMKEQKRKHVKNVTFMKFQEAFGSGQNGLLRAALGILYHEKKLIKKRVGKSDRWSLPNKKDMDNYKVIEN